MTLRMFAVTVAALLLAACGGGGGVTNTAGGGTMVPPITMPKPVPSAVPTASPTPGVAPAGTATILGAAGFTSHNGFTLYVFGADAPNVSNCNGACAAIWPPFMASATAQNVGSFTVITRADGSKQWAFNGHPLYNFTGDAKVGDANGEGLNLNGGIWHVARP